MTMDKIKTDNVHYRHRVCTNCCLNYNLKVRHTLRLICRPTDICIKTNAHRRKYDPHRLMNHNPNSEKYNRVIRFLFPPETFIRKGYSYWDNSNELTDRLRLLLVSYDAGHTRNSYKIASIIEELWEAGFIKGSGK